MPQGTKLGPGLFVVMINDLQTKCDTYKHVDDTCIVYTGLDSQAPNLQEAADAATKVITRKAGKRLFLLLQLKRSGIPVEDSGIRMSSMVDLTHIGSPK